MAEQSLAGTACRRPECTGDGVIDDDGYCTECGLAPLPAPAPAANGASAAKGGSGPKGETGNGVAPSAPGGGSAGSEHSSRTGSARSMTGRSRSNRTHSGRAATSRSVSVRSHSSRSGPRRGRLGADLVTVPPVPPVDPRSVVQENPEVPERKRYCSKCESAVGRGREGRPGRTEGFCTKCGTSYSFSPKLFAGDLVGGQYEVVGCLAHGGQGWIYLAIDRRVNDRWVVLKGLLNTGDEEAIKTAIAERRYLAEVDHPNIVRIVNFAEHPDLRTGTVDGYIVMEYVGGKSLKDIANSRRTPDGKREPLPVEQAIAYALEALPALGYLHSRGLVYCDFKLDNVIQSEDTLKIIDMGAVRRADDDGPIFGTVGYQAPEVAYEGVSPASDLYTVARTLAVLSFDFQGYTTVFRESLPGPEDVEVFNAYESYYRLLVRGTDPEPDRRFSSAAEMAEQLTGVLREILALKDGQPRPALSTLFGPELRAGDTRLLPDHEPGRSSTPERAAGAAPAVIRLDPREAGLGLPVPRIDPEDRNAGFLAALMVTAPHEVINALRSAPVASIELRLRELRALVELGDMDGVRASLADLEQEYPADWRVVWYRGLSSLIAAGTSGADGQPPTAQAAEALLSAAADDFDALYDAFPGEAAPKLALGVCAELLGEREDAAEFYRLVWTTDRAYVSAAFGLARVRLAAGDRAGAVQVLESVPETSSHYVAARVAAIRARIRDRAPSEGLEADLLACAGQLETLGLDTRRHEQLTVEVLDTALAWVLAGSPAGEAAAAGSSSGSSSGPAGGPPVLLGKPAEERPLRFALERSYRMLARLADEPGQRIEWVERANRTRPRTWV
jgi:serine/threonine-protein kinase PknG